MRAAAVEHRVLTTWCRRRFRKLQTTSRVLATTFITAVRTTVQILRPASRPRDRSRDRSATT